MGVGWTSFHRVNRVLLVDTPLDGGFDFEINVSFPGPSPFKVLDGTWNNDLTELGRLL